MATMHRRFDPTTNPHPVVGSDDDVLGLPEAAAALGVGEAVERRLLREGLLIGEKLRGEWVVDHRGGRAVRRVSQDHTVVAEG